MSQMNSDINSELNSIISEAFDDASKPVERSYGQLGFMESDVVQRIFQAFEAQLGETDIVDVIQECRVERTAQILANIKITDLHTVTHNCKKCQNVGITPSPNLPKWNVNDPDVVFVLDSPIIDQQSSALFVSSLKSVGFSSERVCLTYLVRCPIHPSAISKEHFDNCSSYLHQEIQIMNPKLICPIGTNALKFFFGPDAAIKNYKGKISWLGSWPVFPLYSLSYIIKAGNVAQDSFHADMLQAYQFCYRKGN